VLNSELRSLNLENLKWVKNEHMQKIGYLAINILDLNLSGTELNDSTLGELGRSC